MKIRNDVFCLAPWTHTYLSPQHERRLCCASRESAQNFKQYIDTDAGTNQYNPVTLEKWWNSDHLKRVRRDMIEGRECSECDVCNNKLLNTDVYRSYFNRLFGDKYEQLMSQTNADGTLHTLPVSFDYRFTNLCNFKCRQCGDMLSSAWETEEKIHNMWDPKEKPWMVAEVKQQIDKFTDEQIKHEFYQAIEDRRLEEVYWVGGEPLMWEEHWTAMKRVIELDLGKQVYARYNTNLSRVAFAGCNLYSDILAHLRDWQVCASIDGTGAIGEYIRTGLKWPTWLANFKEGLQYAKHPRQMMLDYTVTLPGLFEAKRMFDLSQELGVRLLTKITFAFGSDIAMSPLFLPKHILHPIVEDILNYTKPKATAHQQPFIDVFENLLTRKTFEEEYTDFEQGRLQGKQRIIKLEQIRNDTYTMQDILREHNEQAYNWWQSIRPN